MTQTKRGPGRPRKNAATREAEPISDTPTVDTEAKTTGEAEKVVGVPLDVNDDSVDATPSPPIVKGMVRDLQRVSDAAKDEAGTSRNEVSTGASGNAPANPAANTGANPTESESFGTHRNLQQAADHMSTADAHEHPVAPPAEIDVPAVTGRQVEVELLRAYMPAGSGGFVSDKIPKGAVLKLPAKEAQRALKLNIATATDKTFD